MNVLKLASAGGTYVLLLELARQTRIVAGKLGELQFEPGWYAYVGSAQGPGGLRARIGRHVGLDKTCRWHVDYLRAVCQLREVWYVSDGGRRECPWAQTIQQWMPTAGGVPGFGASDCHCAAHLFYFARRPSLVGFRRRLQIAEPAHPRLERLLGQ